MKKIISVLIAFAVVMSLTVAAQARLVGDVNSDGTVTSSDALIVLQYSIGSIKEINKTAADVDANGDINSSDALNILKICVGSYDGELEVPDELVTHYRDEIVLPVINSGHFTIETTVDIEGEPSDAKIMIDGKNFCTDMNVQGIKARLLVLNGKAYMILPDLHVYFKADDLGDIEIPDIGAGGADNSKYIKSEYVTADGVKYICETYQLPDGGVQKYYFLNGQWKMLETTENGETTVQQIKSLKKGVDKSASASSV